MARYTAVACRPARIRVPLSGGPRSPPASREEVDAPTLAAHRLWQESGATVLYVTHNIAAAVYLSDRVLLLYARPTRVYRDVPIPGERPRHYGDPRLVALENDVTEDCFANVMAGADEL